MAVGSRLHVVGGDVVYRGTGDAETWRLPVASLVLLAERTTAGGNGDDYFLEFGTLLDGEPCLTECAVPGDVEEFLRDLSLELGARLTLRLGETTVFASRIVWPVRMAGKPLYVQRETALHAGMARVRRKIFGGDTEWVVSAEVFEVMSGGS